MDDLEKKLAVTPMDWSGISFKDKVWECRRVANKSSGFMYFLDTYAYIEDKENNIAIRPEWWPEQRRVIPEILDNMLMIVLKARQLGLTWLVCAYVAWCSITKPLHLSIIISVNEDLAIEFLDRVNFILDRCPNYLKPKIKSKTKQQLEFLHDDNLVSTIKSLPTTEMGAQSKTPNLLILDETCKNRMVKDIYNASLPGIEAAKGQVIMISNSIKEGAGWEFTKKVYVDSMNGVNKFKRIFLNWRAKPSRPDDFIEKMIQSGMSERDVKENYPETELEAIEERNIRGVYYAQQMSAARQQGRICSVPYVEGSEVYTFWDYGIDDCMSIWFMQQIGLSYRFIDYYENTGMGLLHYAKVLKEKGYNYGDHYVPHDFAVREGGGDTDVALSRKETAEKMGISPILIVKRARDTQAVLNGIEAARNLIGQCYFDSVKCSDGITCLDKYHSEWDEDKQVLGLKPEHDQYCHGADSFRTFAVGYETQVSLDKKPREFVNRVSSPNSYMGG
jgi:hypothetical protein